MLAASLPPLREDLRLLPAAPNRDGSPAWMVEDPVGNRFFRLGWLEFEVLSRWNLRDPALVARRINQETPLQVGVEQVARIAEFMTAQQLTTATDAAGVQRLTRSAHQGRFARLRWLLHHYLFFRLPLLRPQRWLQALAPWCDVFYSRAFLLLTLAATLLGITLALRQWDAFAHTFTNFMSPAGLFGWALALILAKALHELGHAVTATRLGVRVAHMGVAFLVLWPMLYTDTGESWKLTRRGDRFRIAAAGIAVELALAGFATLAWSLLPDGPARSAVFFLATTSWIVTLGINASPFMRFDGYFLLSDALDLPNLHARSFALARAALRRGLLGWREPDPERVSPGLRRFLIGFAWLTWAYRLSIFVAIAVAVYLFFFKALGILLFVVEIAWFIVRPVVGETSVWWRRRAETGRARALLLMVLALVAAAALLVPWQRHVSAEAWLHAARAQSVYSPFAARVVSLRAAGPVAEGEWLAELDAPELRARVIRLQAGAEALRAELAGTVARADGAWRRNLILENLARERAALASEEQELARLRLSAPFDGILLDRDPLIGEGSWVSERQPLAILVDPESWVIDALVAQEDVESIAVGARAGFYRRGDAGAPLHATVTAVDRVRLRSLPDPALADVHGGRVATTRESDGALTPRDALYRVRLTPEAGQDFARHGIALGSARIEGAHGSVLARWATHALSVLIRESGF
ncbi:MAG: HlyD family efflux transporter periplasmic adaptor subunit [Burkholderiaceae bacterium]